MSEPIITVENLGKRYWIRHQADRQRYRALRDVIAEKLSAPLVFLRNREQNPPDQRGEVPVPHRAEIEDFWALRHISFDVAHGEVVGIIGRNGAGKSTLLKVLSRITEPTEGRAVLRGRIASLLEVGTGFHPELTGRENVYLNGAILGMTRAEIRRKFDEIVSFAGVEKFLDTPVKRYSSGMYVRLAFAVAAHLEPEILVVDEVLAVGDAEFQKKCLGKMNDVASEGRTVLFVSHNLTLIATLCRRAILLNTGTIQEDGSVGEVIGTYHTMSRSGEMAVNPFDRSLRTCSFPVFIAAALHDETGQETRQLPLGGRFRLAIDVESVRHLQSPHVGVGIDDMLGRRLLTLHSPVRGSILDAISGRGRIICHVDSLPLAPGEYSIKLAISDRAEELDVIDQALYFDVLEADGLRGHEDYSRGVCVAQSQWQYSPGGRPDPAALRASSIHHDVQFRTTQL